jgi:hypothetical protein
MFANLGVALARVRERRRVGEELRTPSAEEMDDLFARINRSLFTLHREVVKERTSLNEEKRCL